MDVFIDLGIQNLEDNNYPTNENSKIIPDPTNSFLKIELNSEDNFPLLIFNTLGENL